MTHEAKTYCRTLYLRLQRLERKQMMQMGFEVGGQDNGRIIKVGRILHT